MAWYDVDLVVPPEHKLSCTSQDYTRWSAHCSCGWRSPWVERESWSLLDWRLHVEALLTSALDQPWNWSATSPPA